MFSNSNMSEFELREEGVQHLLSYFFILDLKDPTEEKNHQKFDSISYRKKMLHAIM